ncbi:MAG: penicillin-binding transpeptidase domain-containing protein [Eubacteriales bacterium]|nr:penicillin-binding transpeptidase domain-containing protein [Eubacteriales bacterium]
MTSRKKKKKRAGQRGRIDKREKKFDFFMQKKLLLLFGIVVVVFFLLNFRIAGITLENGEEYTQQVLSQKYYDSVTIPYKRGDIVDRNGNVFARSEKVCNVVLDCFAINSDPDFLEPTLEALEQIFEIDKNEVRGLITAEETRESRYQVILKDVDFEKEQEFEKLTETEEIPDNASESEKARIKGDNAWRSCVKGVWFEESYIREYPMNSMASTVVGFSNKANDGVAGLELYYNDILNGTNGREYGYLTEQSELERKIVEPQDGNRLVTTIDMNIQRVVEKYLNEIEQEHAATGPEQIRGNLGSQNTGIIVADPNTGEILAMATNRGYDLNDPFNLDGWYTEEEIAAFDDTQYSEAVNDRWKNYCVQDSFEPGSTFKSMTIASGLELGAISDSDTFYCDGGEQLPDYYIGCNNLAGHGMQTVSQAMENSCNDALMEIAKRIGIEAFCEYQELFNYGRRTGIDLPNESSGIVFDTQSMGEVELATCSFGQGLTCTMIQELAATCAIVNGGYYYQPHLVKQIQDADGGVVKNIDPVLIRQVISEKNSAQVRDYMEKVVTEGTGKYAQVPGYRVGGKTGTAEIVKDGQRVEDRYVVSFIGFVPADDPQIVIYVVVDQPNVEKQEQGSFTQVVARKILMEILPYLKIYPTEEITDEQLQTLGITREEATEGMRLSDSGTTSNELIGDGSDYQNLNEGEWAGNQNFPAPPEGENMEGADELYQGGMYQADLYQ